MIYPKKFEPFLGLAVEEERLQPHVAAPDMGPVIPLDPRDGDLLLGTRRHLPLCLLLLGLHYGDSMDLLSPCLRSFGVMWASAGTISVVHAGDCAAFLMENFDCLNEIAVLALDAALSVQIDCRLIVARSPPREKAHCCLQHVSQQFGFMALTIFQRKTKHNPTSSKNRSFRSLTSRQQLLSEQGCSAISGRAV